MTEAILTHENIDPQSRNRIMIGIALAMLVACFDGSITTTCGPEIGNSFNNTSLLPWLTMGYLLFETIMIPISGKLSDLYGRKKLLTIGLALFLLSSIVATIGISMEIMICARAIQGMAGGIIIPVATAVIADLYPPEERAKMQGALGALFGIGLGIGPLIGGALASMEIAGIPGWHFAFAINIPLLLITIFMCKEKFPMPANLQEKPKIDYKGIVLISILLVIFIIYFQLFGTAFDVISIESLAMIFVMVGIIILLSRVESKATEPIIAPHVLKNPTVRSASLLLFLLGFSMIGDELFTSMFLQKIEGYSAINAGMFMLCMIAGMAITSSVAGRMVEKTGYKPWIFAGPILMAVGMCGMSFITDFSVPQLAISEFVFGLGVGCLMASLMACVQNSCEDSEVGMTTSVVSLFRNIGSTIGSSVYTMMVTLGISYYAIEQGITQWANEGLGILEHLGGLFDEQIKFVFTNSVSGAFALGTIVLIMAAIIGYRFKIVHMSKTKEILDLENKE
ncbi:MAG: MFS transporter [Thermoplasmata archaeon]|nr:MFS transporter [Thermoplasmata archaeon]